MAVVDEPLAVDRLVMADGQVPFERDGRADRVLVDRDRLDPVQCVLERGGASSRSCATSIAAHGSEGIAPTFRNSEPRGSQDGARRRDPAVGPGQVVAPGKGVVIGAIPHAEVVRRRRDDGRDGSAGSALNTS